MNARRWGLIGLIFAAAAVLPAWSQTPEPVASDLTPAPVEAVPATAPATVTPAEPALPAEPPTPAEMTPAPAAEPPAVEVTATPGNGGSELISLNLEDVPLNDVISMFIKISNANIISSPSTNMNERVTAHLKDVDWRTALGQILEMHNLTLNQPPPGSNVYVIGPPRPPQALPLFPKAFTLQYQRPENLTNGIVRLLGEQGRLIHASGNQIAVLGTTKQLEDVQNLIAQVDMRIPQVVIEAKFVELNDEAIKDLGINWESLGGVGGASGGLKLTGSGIKSDYSGTREVMNQAAGARGVTTTDSDLSTRTRSRDNLTDTTTADGTTRTSTRGDAATTIGVSGRNFSDVDFAENTITTVPLFHAKTIQSAILSAADFSVTLSALKQNSGVSIVSNPKVIVASGEAATILVGQKDPEVRAVQSSQFTNVLTYERKEWIETGVRLEVRPIVNTDEIISVQITPTLSRIADYIETGDTKVKLPILLTREIKSQFNVPSGRTVAIGGLTTTENREEISKIPFLGDIPLIGKYLFSHTHTKRVQDELIIFVTLGISPPEDVKSEAGIPSEERLLNEQYQNPTAPGRLKLRSREKQPAAAPAPAPVAPAPAT